MTSLTRLGSMKVSRSHFCKICREVGREIGTLGVLGNIDPQCDETQRVSIHVLGGGGAMHRLGVLGLIVVLSLMARADENQTIPITNELKQMTGAQVAKISASDATLKYEDAGAFLSTVFPNLGDKEYCIIHIVRWGPKNAIDKQNWYVFENKRIENAGVVTFSNRLSKGDFSGTRLYGIKKLAFVYVYLNTQDDPLNRAISYRVDISPKTPDNLQNLFALLKFVVAPAAPPPPPDAYYAATEVTLSSSTADVKITAFVTKDAGGGGAPPTAPAQLTSNTFDNEGRYYWDVDFAVPLKSYKDVQVDTTNNVVTPKSITRQNVFATFEVYPIPVDTKRAVKVFVPSLVAGIPISGKPLNRYIVALGMGTNYFRGFIGVGIDRRVATTTGTTTTTPAQDQWIRKLSFGITVPLRPVLKTFKSSSTKGS